MLAYYLNILILFFKSMVFFVNTVLVYNQDFAKIIVSLLFLGLIIYLRKPEKTRFNKLSLLKKYRTNKIFKYGLYTKVQKLLSWLYIFVYILVFFVGFFILRLFNRNNIINLRETFMMLYQTCLQLNYIQLVVNLIFFILGIGFLMLLFHKLKNYFFFQVIRQHIYFSDKVFYKKLYYYIKFNIAINLETKIYNIVDNCLCYIFTKKWKLNLENPEDSELFDVYHSKHDTIISIVHCIRRYLSNNLYIIILGCVLLYDLFWCNLTIHYTFNMLPFLFLYSIYCNIIRFIIKKDFAFDEIINNVLYHDFVPLSKDYMLIDGKVEKFPNWVLRFIEYSSKGFEI